MIKPLWEEVPHRRPVTVDDWGEYEYWVGGMYDPDHPLVVVEHETHEKRDRAKASGAYKLDGTKGGTCSVRWPDGTIERCTFVSHKVDYTHEQGASWDHLRLSIETTHRGAPARVHLGDVEIAAVRQ